MIEGTRTRRDTLLVSRTGAIAQQSLQSWFWPSARGSWSLSARQALLVSTRNYPSVRQVDLSANSWYNTLTIMTVQTILHHVPSRSSRLPRLPAHLPENQTLSPFYKVSQVRIQDDNRRRPHRVAMTKIRAFSDQDRSLSATP